MIHRIYFLNAIRWIRFNFLLWLALGLLYSVSATLLFQPMQMKLFHRELSFGSLWASVMGMVLLPFLLSRIPFFSIPFVESKKRFPKLIQKISGGRIGSLFIAQELRKSQAFVLSLGVLAIWIWKGQNNLALWVLLSQAPLQSSLYSVAAWRNFCAYQGWIDDAEDFLRGFTFFHAIVGVFSGALVSILSLQSYETTLLIIAATATAQASGASVAMEGDSGRPFLVNFLSLAVGTLSGILVLWSPWFLILIGYSVVQVHQMARRRFKSVESLNEDAVF